MENQHAVPHIVARTVRDALELWPVGCLFWLKGGYVMTLGLVT